MSWLKQLLLLEDNLWYLASMHLHEDTVCVNCEIYTKKHDVWTLQTQCHPWLIKLQDIHVHACTAPLACVAGRRREGKGSKGAREYRGEGGRNGLQGRYCFLGFFYVHQTNVKILIGQILWITQSVVLIGQRPIIQENRSSHIHSFI